jgi:enamine deaminase RidA (YjgF/YER057c/UK114 family)
MERVNIGPAKDAKPIGAVSASVKVINASTLIFVSTQGPVIKGTQEIVKGDIKVQAKLTFENLKYELERAGATLNDVVQIHSFLKHKEDYAGFNEVRREYLKDNLPVSSTLIVKDLLSKDENERLEVGVIAAL